MQVLAQIDENDLKFVPLFKLGKGKFGLMVQDDLASMPVTLQNHWHELFHHVSQHSSRKPSNKFILKANSLIDAIGTCEFKQRVNRWFLDAAEFSVSEVTHGDGTYSNIRYEYIEEVSFDLLKGLLWSMCRFHDQKTMSTIALFVENYFKKIIKQDIGLAAVGNAGIYTLAHSKGLTGISHLSRLKMKIRRNSTQKLIQQYIDEQAAKKGIKPAHLEEIAVSDYGLVDGQRIEQFDDYQLIIALSDVGVVNLQWLKPDGKVQKTVPAFVRSNKKFAEKLKTLKDLTKQIKLASISQRDRIDRLYTENISWTVVEFENYYLNHGLVSKISRRLIWCLEGQPALFVQGQWQDEQGRALKTDPQTSVRLWHPSESNPELVTAWRKRLESLQIKQPFKQAYREIYLLTDAEFTTRIYSNRMAAHILNQKQFNALAAIRGWNFSQIGAFGLIENTHSAKKAIPEYQLTAQLWIDILLDEEVSEYDNGLFQYVVSDQVRFSNNGGEDVPLVDIPPLIFSEIMRDVDLFVGVASIGNDPQWHDGGPEQRTQFREYWHAYSMAELSEVAKTRKFVLKQLLPKLAIHDVVTIDDRYVIVQGKIHQYKINIASTNILIASNNHYLCIVPSRNDKKVEQIFLPFEGDLGLSIILSKALLLTNDDKITDQSILSQL